MNVKPAVADNHSIVKISLPARAWYMVCGCARAWFMVVADLNESVILTQNVVTLMREVAHYNV
jgi:hypothetical protein